MTAALSLTSPLPFREKSASPFLILGLERLAAASPTAARENFKRMMQVPVPS
jgi:hypothetical protein